MSWRDLLGAALNGLVSLTKTGATVAATAGVSSVTISGAKVSISSLTTALDQLAKADIGGDLKATDFKDLKSFLLSSQLEDDMLDVSDVLSVIGLFSPPVAVAANDIKVIATALTVFRKSAILISSLDIFAGLVPDGRGGFVSQAWIDDPRHQLNPDGTFKN